jgi:hypothetical protein
MLPLVIGAAALLALGLFVGAVFIGRARARQLGDDVRTAVLPYLRRKASEMGLDPKAPVFTSRTEPEEIVTHAVGLAERLLEHERTGYHPSHTQELGLARTQPVDDSQELVVTGKSVK